MNGAMLTSDGIDPLTVLSKAVQKTGSWVRM